MVSVDFTTPAETAAVITSYGAIGDGSTDNTSAVNQLIANVYAAGGGDVIVPPGKFVGAFDLTNIDGVRLIGQGAAIGSGKGSILLPRPDGAPVVDLSGGSCRVSNLQIGSAGVGFPMTTGGIGLLMAQTTTRAGQYCTLNDPDDVFITGTWTKACLYAQGTADWKATRCRFWNYLGQNAPVVLCRLPHLGASSVWQPLDTSGSYGSGNIKFDDCELHDFVPSGRSSGGALLMWGTGRVDLINGSMIDSSTTAAAIQMATEGGTSCLLRFDGNFSSQNGTASAYGYGTSDSGHTVGESAMLGRGYTTKYYGGITFTSL